MIFALNAFTFCRMICFPAFHRFSSDFRNTHTHTKIYTYTYIQVYVYISDRSIMLFVTRAPSNLTCLQLVFNTPVSIHSPPSDIFLFTVFFLHFGEIFCAPVLFQFFYDSVGSARVPWFFIIISPTKSEGMK